jgi:hypothetical protein
MTIEDLEKLLAKYQHMLLVTAGAGVTLLATAVADLPNHPQMYFPGWYAVWFILQLATVIPVAVLLLGNGFVQLPFAERLNTIAGYSAVAWIVLAASGLRVANTGAISFLWLWVFLGCLGIALSLVYWLLRRRLIHSPEANFP